MSLDTFPSRPFKTLTDMREEAEDVPSNRSGNPTMGDVINARMSRRGMLTGSLAVTARGAPPPAMGCASRSRSSGPKRRVTKCARLSSSRAGPFGSTRSRPARALPRQLRIGERARPQTSLGATTLKPSGTR